MSRKIEVQFERQIRRALLTVEAWGMADDDGIHKTGISDVLLDEVSVLGLLTEDDLSEIDDAIAPAIEADAEDDSLSAYGPGDRHQLGD